MVPNMGKCVYKCPAGVISLETCHDKLKCSNYCFNITLYIKKNYGIDNFACTLFQIGVPFENNIPSDNE